MGSDGVGEVLKPVSKVLRHVLSSSVAILAELLWRSSCDASFQQGEHEVLGTVRSVDKGRELQHHAADHGSL